MDYGDFKVMCVLHGIDAEVIDAIEPYIRKETQTWPYYWTNRVRHESADLGFAELSDILTKEQGIQEIKRNIKDSTDDYDARGRSLETVRMRQLIKNPHKSLQRAFLKTYYLANGQVIA